MLDCLFEVHFAQQVDGLVAGERELAYQKINLVVVEFAFSA